MAPWCRGMSLLSLAERALLRLLLPLWRRIGNIWKWRILYLVHAKFMVSVVGIVLDDQHRVLLLRHRFWKSAAWGLPSGYAQRCERLEDALAREVREETGYHIDTPALVRVASGFRLWVEVTYRAQISGGTERLDGREILAARFFAADELPDTLPPEHRALIVQAQQAQVAYDDTF